MAYLTAERETTTIQLPSDNNYWIKFYKTLDYGDTKKLSSAASGEDIEVGDAIFKSMICEWNLDDEQGNVLPITSENIDRLRASDAQAVMNAISEAMPVAEKKDSPDQS